MAIPEKEIYPRTGDRQTIYLRPVITDPNITVGEYTMYNDFVHDPTEFQTNNVLYHYPVNGDRLTIGKFCSIACGAKFLFTSANHTMRSLSTYPFPLFFEEWGLEKSRVTDAWDNRGDIVVGSDVWIGRESVILPGVHIGDGAIIAARSVVAKDVPPYTVAGGNPVRVLKQRFPEDLVRLLLAWRWWDLPPEELAEAVPLLCDPDLDAVRSAIRQRLEK